MPFIGKAPDVGAFRLIDSITTSATDTYALQVEGLSYFPASARNLIVSLNGVTQAPESAYTVSGSDIVFASALTASDVIDYILVIGDAVDIGTPSDGTVGTSQLASSIDLSGKTLTFANDQISGDAIDGGTATLDGLTVDTDTLVVDSTNNRVGIGGSPSCPLHVKKDGYLKVIVQDASGTNTPLSIGSGNNGVTLSNNASADTADEAITLNQISQSAIFYTAGTERMRIDSSGNLLVGATSQVSTETLGVTTSSGFVALFKANQPSSTAVHTAFYNSSGLAAKIDRAGLYTQVSDRSLKHDISDSTLGLKEVLNIPVRSFKWNGSNDYIAAGFIAQELEEALPSAVSTDEDTGLKGRSDGNIVPVLTKAIQEQQAMIETLQAQVAELQGAN
jgi:hypothetical protein